MRVSFKPSFIKDFKRLPQEAKEAVRWVCTEAFPPLKDLREFNAYHMKPIRGFKNYYRIRLGDYRIGLKESGKEVVFMRVRHRKDIYKVFP